MKPCNVPNMTKFLEALRCGDYMQAGGTLRRVNGDGTKEYCCLGVATDVALKEGADLEHDPTRPVPHIWDNGALPSSVVEWLGVDDPDPLLRFPRGEMIRATTANDVMRKGFWQIARAFEDTYLREVKDDDSE